MSTAAVALVVGILGLVGTLANVVVNLARDRRSGRVEERRLNLEELQAVTMAQREELDDLRAQRREDRAEIDSLRRQIDAERDQHKAEIEALRSDLLKAHHAIDQLQLVIEARRST